MDAQMQFQNADRTRLSGLRQPTRHARFFKRGIYKGYDVQPVPNIIDSLFHCGDIYDIR